MSQRSTRAPGNELWCIPLTEIALDGFLLCMLMLVAPEPEARAALDLGGIEIAAPRLASTDGPRGPDALVIAVDAEGRVTCAGRAAGALGEGEEALALALAPILAELPADRVVELALDRRLALAHVEVLSRALGARGARLLVESGAQRPSPIGAPTTGSAARIEPL